MLIIVPVIGASTISCANSILLSADLFPYLTKKRRALSPNALTIEFLFKFIKEQIAIFTAVRFDGFPLSRERQ
jgi:hypothetical protein